MLQFPRHTIFRSIFFWSSPDGIFVGSKGARCGQRSHLPAISAARLVPHGPAVAQSVIHCDCAARCAASQLSFALSFAPLSGGGIPLSGVIELLIRSDLFCSSRFLSRNHEKLRFQVLKCTSRVPIVCCSVVQLNAGRHAFLRGTGNIQGACKNAVGF